MKFKFLLISIFLMAAAAIGGLYFNQKRTEIASEASTRILENMEELIKRYEALARVTDSKARLNKINDYTKSEKSNISEIINCVSRNNCGPENYGKIVFLRFSGKGLDEDGSIYSRIIYEGKEIRSESLVTARNLTAHAEHGLELNIFGSKILVNPEDIKFISFSFLGILAGDLEGNALTGQKMIGYISDVSFDYSQKIKNSRIEELMIGERLMAALNLADTDSPNNLTLSRIKEAFPECAFEKSGTQGMIFSEKCKIKNTALERYYGDGRFIDEDGIEISLILEDGNPVSVIFSNYALDYNGGLNILYGLPGVSLQEEKCPPRREYDFEFEHRADISLVSLNGQPMFWSNVVTDGGSGGSKTTTYISIHNKSCSGLYSTVDNYYKEWLAVSDARRKAEERQARAIAYKDNPYKALITCKVARSSYRPAACFAGQGITTKLRVRKNNQVFTYNFYELTKAGNETREGLEIELPSSFQIVAQNAQEYINLGVTIYDQVDQKTIHSEEVGRFGVINISN